MKQKRFFIPALIILTLINLGVLFYPTEPNHLCSTQETIILSCKIKDKNEFMSICSSKDLSKTHGHLKYRYGTVDKIEIEYPKSNGHPEEFFEYSYYTRPYQADDLVTLEVTLYLENGPIMSVMESYLPTESFVTLFTNDDKELNCDTAFEGSLTKLKDLGIW